MPQAALVVRGLSLARGVCNVSVQPRQCPSCHMCFVGCWALGTTSALLVAPPRAQKWFFFQSFLGPGHLAALDLATLDWMTASFLHQHASFSGTLAVLGLLHADAGLSSNDRARVLEHGWFHFALLDQLGPSAVGSAVDLRRESLDLVLSSALPALSSALARQGAAHRCQQCSNSQVVVGDGCWKVTTNLCNERTSSIRCDPDTGLSLNIGCTGRPCRGSLFCKSHQLPPGAEATHGEIRDHRRSPAGETLFRTRGASDFLPSHLLDLQRLRQYDSRQLLTKAAPTSSSAPGTPGYTAACAGPVAATPSPSTPHSGLVGTLRPDSSDVDSCRADKGEARRLVVRKFAGIFTTVLPCQHVLSVDHLVGSESLPQVAFAFARALVLRPSAAFVAYDNACALARFCRNPVRRNLSPTMQRLANSVFVIPQSHLRNHVACVNPAHSMYLPEVCKDAHPQLTGINLECNEQVFSWLRHLLYITNCMTATKHQAFLLLVVLRRNAARKAPVHLRVRKKFAKPAAPKTALRDVPALRPTVAVVEPEPLGVLNTKTRIWHKAFGLGLLACRAPWPDKNRVCAMCEVPKKVRLCRHGCW